MGQDKLTEAHERLARAVEEMTTGEDWRAYLAFAAKFYNYSPNNVLLIMTQNHDATQVAGYRAWQALGRQVRKGEKAIGVLAPCKYRGGDGTEAADDEGKVIRGFRVASVFDVSQTDGDPLPEVERPVRLEGDAPAQMWDFLAAQVERAGFELKRNDCGKANGCTNHLANSVTVRPDLDPAQAVKTLAHELAHVMLHDRTKGPCGGRGQIEVEAESVAFLVCETAGMTTDAYSFPYVAGWSGGDTDLLRSTAAKVIATARTITAGLGERPVEVLTAS